MAHDNARPAFYSKLSSVVKYRLECEFQYQLDIDLRPWHAQDIETRFMALSLDGLLTLRPGFLWDGPTGPMPDRAEMMRGSLVHDALYDLMRLKKLDRDPAIRAVADRAMHDLFVADGTPPARAKLLHNIVSKINDAAFVRRAMNPISVHIVGPERNEHIKDGCDCSFEEPVKFGVFQRLFLRKATRTSSKGTFHRDRTRR